MNGMVIDSWPYVVAAYVATWVVIIGYAVRLTLMSREQRATSSSRKSSS